MIQKRRPFWLPASNYYVLSAAVALTVFFLIWGILNDSGEETPWIAAGISAGVLLSAAVILREIVLRRARKRIVRDQLTIENRVRSAAVRASLNARRDQTKLTIEDNAAVLDEIRQKSTAAKVLNKFSSGHREVFEMCGEYILLNENELKNVNPNSPRLAPLLKGRTAVHQYHRFHLLKWAEIEAGNLTTLAQNQAQISDKIGSAQAAVNVIETALGYYPQEPSLLDSRDLLREMLVSMKISDIVEQAERAAFKGELLQAKSLYQDALFSLSQVGGHENVASRIREEMRSLDALKSS